MVRNNRKKDALALPVTFAAFVTVVVGVVAVGLVCAWMAARCDALGKEIQKVEAEQARLEKQYRIEEAKWTRLKSPENLVRVLAERHIDMAWPGPDQTVHVFEAPQPVGEPPAYDGRSALTLVTDSRETLHD